MNIMSKKTNGNLKFCINVDLNSNFLIFYTRKNPTM